jgi:uncharacterized protein (UPF0332 family)
MAIVNTLDQCLASPYLFTDQDAPSRVPSLLAHASDRLEAASAILERGTGDADDIIQYSYEAMFACLRALVYAKGYREAGLRCLILACDALYVRPGLLDAGHLQAMERLLGRRVRPEESRKAAACFLSRSEELVGQAGRSASPEPPHPGEGS